MAANSPEKRYTLRCSTVYICEGEETFVYRSFDEMPPVLRKRVLASARAGGAATIFIANRGGRDELARRWRGLPSRIKTRLERTVELPPDKTVEPPKFAGIPGSGSLSPSVRHALLLATGGALLALLLTYWR